MIDAVIEYISKGYNVIPIKPRGKTPLVEWTQYQSRRVTEHQATEWFERWPDANVAIITGAISGGLVVVDVDTNEWPADPDQAADLLGAAIVLTGRGGRHYYFNGSGVRNSASKIAPNVDIRGDGGYVVAPPSMHSSGVRYSWLDGEIDCATELQSLPEWIATIKTDSGRNAEGWLEELLVNGASQGGRNDACTKVVGHYVNLGLSGPEINALVGAWNQAANKPPLTDKEIGNIVASIFRIHLLKKTAYDDIDDSDESRYAIMQKISERFGIKLEDVAKVGGDEPYYQFTVDGKIATLADGSLQFFNRWSSALEAANVIPDKLKKNEDWRMNWARPMLKIMRHIEPSIDASVAGEIAEWVESYLTHHVPIVDDISIMPHDPIVRSGTTYISSTALLSHARMRFGTRMGSRKLAQEFARLGFRRYVLWIKTENVAKAVKFYSVPLTFLQICGKDVTPDGGRG